jgi:hypothetical protein
MKRILWTITAVGALAVPVGMVAAQTDDDTTVDTETPTTVVCDQDQQRLQLHRQDGTGDQERAQQRLQAHECDGCLQARERVQVRVEDGQGDMVRNQARLEECGTCTGDQVRARDGATVQEQDGAAEDQTGQQDSRRYQQQDRLPSGTADQVGPGRSGR